MTSWFVMTSWLSRQEKIREIAERSGIDRWGVVGRLADFWSWVTDQPTAPSIPGVTVESLARELGVEEEFLLSLARTGWAVFDPAGLFIPEYDIWLSASAKNRLAVEGDPWCAPAAGGARIAEVTHEILAAWLEEVKPGDQTITAARRHVTYLLHDHSPQDLFMALEAYSRDLLAARRADPSHPPIPMGASRFFSVEFQAYLERGQEFRSEVSE